MRLFLADNHYDIHPGAIINRELRERYGIESRFYEDDVESFLEMDPAAVDLLILNHIGDTCGVEHAGREAEAWMQQYLASGKPVFLQHGSSAAFWKWDWWRTLVGFRWVRPNDPDGVEKSTHPHVEVFLRKAKARHPLMERLREFTMPEDELYIDLETVSPTLVLMEADWEGKSYPMLFETAGPAGNKLVTWLPGHRETTLTHPDFLHNCVEVIRYLEG